jgi:release factor glutamine methyltransferase
MPKISAYVLSGADRLRRGPHPERALADAELLMMRLLGKDKAWLLAYWNDNIGDRHAAAYDSMIDHRFQGEPVQYIVGETEFYGLPFLVTPDVLIPRPETEHLVEQAIALAREFPQARIVDVGAGSGAIAVALATHLPEARITTIDVCKKALAVARENATRNGVSERVRFFAGDLLEPVGGELFDLVVSNPPYVAEADRALLSVEVREYEPAHALFAGEDGLDVYRRLIPPAHAALAPGGHILLEIGYGQAEGVRALLAESGFAGIHFVPDLQGIARVACGKR